MKELEWINRLLMHLNFLNELSRTRYLAARVPQPRIATLQRTYEVLLTIGGPVFMKWARMSNESFLKLAANIASHYIFHNNSNHPQAPVEWQLLVALSNLGLCGNEGSVENYTNGCILAIIETLEKDHVYWPTAEDRERYTLACWGRTVFDKWCRLCQWNHLSSSDGTFGTQGRLLDAQDGSRGELLICLHSKQEDYTSGSWLVWECT
ncbi:hypothetical protein PSTG_18212 [Puccinia striiformis f. sp. tritici PST-78]|uniref:Uncharacterized protein n=1 Tax=Puccinia striiformis f. sp. tritici PST-78 TaxID=1165861 RepID=A0A0L0UMX9_9BASI|nr:hypothetical protein PSTG_18212 [Puccinia striiformis f. sp. tritici PST-78]